MSLKWQFFRCVLVLQNWNIATVFRIERPKCKAIWSLILSNILSTALNFIWQKIRFTCKYFIALYGVSILLVSIVKLIRYFLSPTYLRMKKRMMLVTSITLKNGKCVVVRLIWKMRHSYRVIYDSDMLSVKNLPVKLNKRIHQ